MKTTIKKIKLYTQCVEVPKDTTIIRIYSKRCTIVGDRVFSYNTEVAKIDFNAKVLFVKSRAFSYSSTTTGHIRKVIRQFELNLFTDHKFEPIKRSEYSHSFVY